GVTALAAERFGKIHSALLVGASGPKQSFLTVYGLGGKGLAPLAALPLQAPASNILFGDFGDPGLDAAFLSGGQVQILRSTTMKTGAVSVAGTARAFALGSFIWDRNAGPQIAILGANGSVQIAARNEFDPRVYTPTEFNAIRQASVNRKPAPDFVPPHSFPVN